MEETAANLGMDSSSGNAPIKISFNLKNGNDNQAEESSGIPDDLVCSLCRDLLTEAMMMLCCGASYCEECIRVHVADKAKCPNPECTDKDIGPLRRSNNYLRNKTQAYSERTGYVNAKYALLMAVKENDKRQEVSEEKQEENDDKKEEEVHRDESSDILEVVDLPPPTHSEKSEIFERREREYRRSPQEKRGEGKFSPEDKYERHDRRHYEEDYEEEDYYQDHRRRGEVRSWEYERGGDRRRPINNYHRGADAGHRPPLQYDLGTVFPPPRPMGMEGQNHFQPMDIRQQPPLHQPLLNTQPTFQQAFQQQQPMMRPPPEANRMAPQYPMMENKMPQMSAPDVYGQVPVPASFTVPPPPLVQPLMPPSVVGGLAPAPPQLMPQMMHGMPPRGQFPPSVNAPPPQQPPHMYRTPVMHAIPTHGVHLPNTMRADPQQSRGGIYTNYIRGPPPPQATIRGQMPTIRPAVDSIDEFERYLKEREKMDYLKKHQQQLRKRMSRSRSRSRSRHRSSSRPRKYKSKSPMEEEKLRKRMSRSRSRSRSRHRSSSRPRKYKSKSPMKDEKLRRISEYVDHRRNQEYRRGIDHQQDRHYEHHSKRSDGDNRHYDHPGESRHFEQQQQQPQSDVRHYEPHPESRHYEQQHPDPRHYDYGKRGVEHGGRGGGRDGPSTRDYRFDKYRGERDNFSRDRRMNFAPHRMNSVDEEKFKKYRWERPAEEKFREDNKIPMRPSPRKTPPPLMECKVYPDDLAPPGTDDIPLLYDLGRPAKLESERNNLEARDFNEDVDKGEIVKEEPEMESLPTTTATTTAKAKREKKEKGKEGKREKKKEKLKKKRKKDSGLEKKRKKKKTKVVEIKDEEDQEEEEEEEEVEEEEEEEEEEEALQVTTVKGDEELVLDLHAEEEDIGKVEEGEIEEEEEEELKRIAMVEKEEERIKMPELSKWEREGGVEAVAEQPAAAMCMVEEEQSVVTEEIIKRAENALYQKRMMVQAAVDKEKEIKAVGNSIQVTLCPPKEARKPILIRVGEKIQPDKLKPAPVQNLVQDEKFDQKVKSVVVSAKNEPDSPKVKSSVVDVKKRHDRRPSREKSRRESPAKRRPQSRNGSGRRGERQRSGDRNRRCGDQNRSMERNRGTVHRSEQSRSRDQNRSGDQNRATVEKNRVRRVSADLDEKRKGAKRKKDDREEEKPPAKRKVVSSEVKKSGDKMKSAAVAAVVAAVDASSTSLESSSLDSTPERKKRKKKKKAGKKKKKGKRSKRSYTTDDSTDDTDLSSFEDTDTTDEKSKSKSKKKKHKSHKKKKLSGKGKKKKRVKV